MTHWSQACLDVVARESAAVPLRRLLGAVVVGGFSDAWHLFMWRESRSLGVDVRIALENRAGATHLRANWSPQC